MILSPSYQLNGYHGGRLDAQGPVGLEKEVLEGVPQELHDQVVVVPFASVSEYLRHSFYRAGEGLYGGRK